MLRLIGGYELFFVRILCTERRMGKRAPTGRGSYSDNRKRIPEDKVVIQKYLDMVQTVLLELYAGENVHVSHVSVQFLEFKFDMRFGHQLHLLDAKNSGSLAKSTEPAAPPRPETEL
jgi:trehalose/maltose hydrolase-like predicted phosphorylase